MARVTLPPRSVTWATEAAVYTFPGFVPEVVVVPVEPTPAWAEQLVTSQWIGYRLAENLDAVNETLARVGEQARAAAEAFKGLRP